MTDPRSPETIGGPAARRGHRTLPHTADMRVAAWAPTRAECIAEAVLGVAESFTDLGGDPPCRGAETLHLEPGPPEDQLLAALDEVIFQLDTTARVPFRAEAREEEENGISLRLWYTELGAVTQTGASPKGIALENLRFEQGPDGTWTCEVTVDV
ncbi:putative protein archease [Thermobispora bispora]|jgi:SHS2 domain-containing protein|uniref:archease n=1 Tax=Thermobispora bispora TaxID=2006 RepID=UPI00197D5D10|nr:archease [Thermobispora bispora]MBO2472897.1 hypothetical protein [Actinomycetales bacterium]MDI9582123.1 archease [Thermobispora sp.]QSI47487.1 archease [Thermobispora bispora]